MTAWRQLTVIAQLMPSGDEGRRLHFSGDIATMPGKRRDLWRGHAANSHSNNLLHMLRALSVKWHSIGADNRACAPDRSGWQPCHIGAARVLWERRRGGKASAGDSRVPDSGSPAQAATSLAACESNHLLKFPCVDLLLP